MDSIVRASLLLVLLGVPSLWLTARLVRVVPDREPVVRAAPDPLATTIPEDRCGELHEREDCTLRACVRAENPEAMRRLAYVPERVRGEERWNRHLWDRALERFRDCAQRGDVAAMTSLAHMLTDPRAPFGSGFVTINVMRSERLLTPWEAGEAGCWLHLAATLREARERAQRAQRP